MKKTIVCIALALSFCASAASKTPLPKPDALTLKVWSDERAQGKHSEEFKAQFETAQTETLMGFCVQGGMLSAMRQHATMAPEENYKRREDDAWSEYRYGLTRVFNKMGYTSTCDAIYDQAYLMTAKQIAPDEYD